MYWALALLHEILERNRIIDNLFTTKTLKIYIVVASVNGGNLSCIDTTTGNKDMDTKLTGAPIMITEIDSNLLVEIGSEIQCKKIIQIISLASVKVVA